MNFITLVCFSTIQDFLVTINFDSYCIYIWQLSTLLWNLRHFCSTFAINRRNITINFCMQYCNWQLLCTLAIDNFHMHYCSCWILYLLLWLHIFAPTTFECIIEDDNFHIDHCNLHLLFTLLFSTFFYRHYCLWQH